MVNCLTVTVQQDSSTAPQRKETAMNPSRTLLKPASSLPVLEPLSRATQQTLKPIHLAADDYLEIDVDEEGRRFIVQAQAYAVAPDDPEDIRCRICGGKKSHWAHQDHPSGHDYEPFEIVSIGGSPMTKNRHGPSHKAAVFWTKRIPERKELGFGRWSVAATDYTALVIQAVWPEDRLLFVSEEAKLLYEVLINRFELQSRRSRMIADFKVNGTVPEKPKDWVDHPDLPLADYQLVGTLASINQEAYGLICEQGTGKTPMAVARINYEAQQKDQIYRALIICPRQVRSNWSKEFSRFSVVSGKVSIAKGPLVARQRRLIDGIRAEKDCEFGVSILAMDSVRSLWEALKMIPWDLVVVDESHYIKNPSAVRSRWARKLSARSNVKQRMILTGTPIANAATDLWSQFEFLGEGLSGFQTFEGFRRFFGVFEKKKTDQNGSSVKRLVGLQNVPLLQERLTRLCFLITKDEAGLKLPDKVRDMYEVTMTKKQADVYRNVANELVVEIEELMEQDENITVDHILTKLLRLAQICSGHVVFNKTTDPETEETIPGRVVQIDKVNPKVDAVIDMLNDEQRDPNGKTLVWCSFIEDVRVLSEALAERGINHVGYHNKIHRDYRVSGADEAEVRFNKERGCRVFIGNPSSGGVGLNFLGYDVNNPDAYDTYTDHVIYFSSDWSMTNRSQSEDRAHRRGTRMPVRITDLVVPGTIDQEIRERVMAKKATAMQLQDVKEVLSLLLDKYEDD